MTLVGLKNLCTPAHVYLVISVITIIIMGFYNYKNTDIYCLGDYSCKVSTLLVFIIKIIYVLFWTWILNIICSAGATNVAWFLVLLPYVLFFLLLILLLLS